MSNEPVAWMGIRRHGENRVSVEKLDKDDIPLYTHPVELADEEIQKIADEVVDYSEIEMWINEELLKFAKAILRKAQEK